MKTTTVKIDNRIKLRDLMAFAISAGAELVHTADGILLVRLPSADDNDLHPDFEALESGGAE